jgi:hypothetical protein
MINVSTITKQIKSWLESSTDLTEFEVTRSEFVNEDAGKATSGWIGIYRRTVDYDPRNLGIPPNNYEGEVVIDIVIQRSSLKSGEDAEDRLEDSIKKVLDRIVQIPKTFIDSFIDLTVDYTYIEDERTTMYFQGALVSLTVNVSFEVK